MQPLVSVIVPIYNAEKTLRRCLDGLLNQSLKDIEIVCINDGSTDGSLRICQDYASKDGRVRIIDKPNSGVSDTRQTGLDNAKGEYVIQHDADDYVDAVFLETLYNEAVRHNADIVVCDITQLTGSGVRYMDFSLNGHSNEELIRDIITKTHGSLSNRLLRRDDIEILGVRFENGLSYGEDKLFLIKVLNRILCSRGKIKAVHVPKGFVYYDTTASQLSLTKLTQKEWLGKRLALIDRVKEELDLKTYGAAVYQYVLDRAFEIAWNHQANTLSQEVFSDAFAPYENGIKQYIHPSAKKAWVMKSLKKGFRASDKMKWIMAPTILKEKLQRRSKQ